METAIAPTASEFAARADTLLTPRLRRNMERLRLASVAGAAAGCC